MTFSGFKMKYETTICRVQSHYTCKYCNEQFQGLYVFINGELFVKGQCQCSFWLVKSCYLNQTFYY